MEIQLISNKEVGLYIKWIEISISRKSRKKYFFSGIHIFDEEK